MSDNQLDKPSAETVAPNRRWMQVRLSTWFILVAILGWGLATRPYYITRVEMVESVSVGMGRTWERITFPYAHEELNPALAWPVLALVAFILWQTVWRVRHWRAQCGHSTKTSTRWFEA
jgi:hypothetical protein